MNYVKDDNTSKKASYGTEFFEEIDRQRYRTLWRSKSDPEIFSVPLSLPIIQESIRILLNIETGVCR